MSFLPVYTLDLTDSDPGVGDGGFLIWNELAIPAITDWLDPVTAHGLRRASSPQAQGADCEGNRYYVQLVLEGHAFTKKKHEKTGVETVAWISAPRRLPLCHAKARPISLPSARN